MEISANNTSLEIRQNLPLQNLLEIAQAQFLADGHRALKIEGNQQRVSVNNPFHPRLVGEELLFRGLDLAHAGEHPSLSARGARLPDGQGSAFGGEDKFHRALFFSLL